MLKRILKFAPVAALLIVIAAVYSAELRAIPVTASLSSVTGDVRVTLPDGTTTQGTVNMALPSGTRIATGAKSSAVIKWSASNTLKINPFTNFTIKDIDVDPRTKTVTSSLDLQTGKIKAKAEKLHSPSSEFSISTPTAVAGVRGTEFDMENTPENTTSVTTRTGAVEVTSQGQSVMAVGGTQVVVEPVRIPAGTGPRVPGIAGGDSQHVLPRHCPRIGSRQAYQHRRRQDEEGQPSHKRTPPPHRRFHLTTSTPCCEVMSW